MKFLNGVIFNEVNLGQPHQKFIKQHYSKTEKKTVKSHLFH